MAGRMLSHAKDLAGQIEFGVLLATQQIPSRSMLDELLFLHAVAFEEYGKSAEISAKLGESPDAAARVLVANTILNLDTALNR